MKALWLKPGPIILFLFWDGNMQLVVQKGLIGFLISLVIVLVLLLLKRPSLAF